MIEFTDRHADTNEKYWDIMILYTFEDGNSFEVFVPAVSSDDVSMGQVLEYTCERMEEKLGKKDYDISTETIVAYEVLKVERVQRCACCNRIIALDGKYCDYHYGQVESIMQEWNKLVDRS